MAPCQFRKQSRISARSTLRIQKPCVQYKLCWSSEVQEEIHSIIEVQHTRGPDFIRRWIVRKKRDTNSFVVRRDVGFSELEMGGWAKTRLALPRSLPLMYPKRPWNRRDHSHRDPNICQGQPAGYDAGYKEVGMCFQCLV